MLADLAMYFPLFNRFMEGFRELLGDEDGEVRIFTLLVGITVAVDREQAIVRMRRALAEMLFEGVVTATDYQMHILCSKAFVEANFNVNSIANGDFD